jgi:uncharacterized membrane protein YoaK (UPF0700 family)
MFWHRIDQHVPPRVFLQWFMLAFLAGNVNAGAYLGAARFVTHTTGFATLFGLEIAHMHWDQALGILSVPAFYLLGAMLAAYWVEGRERRGKRPWYDWVMFLVFLCLLAAACFGHVHTFGIDWGMIQLKQDYIFLVLLCLASGLQNGAVAIATDSTVRTTHLTGVTTDLGVGLVKAMFIPKEHPSRPKEVQANRFRLGTIVSFVLGSVTGATLFIHLKYLGFLVPAAIAFYAFVHARMHFFRMKAQYRGTA